MGAQKNHLTETVLWVRTTYVLFEKKRKLFYNYALFSKSLFDNWALTYDFQGCGILTCIDSD